MQENVDKIHKPTNGDLGVPYVVCLIEKLDH